MNGEVMDECTVTSELSQNEISTQTTEDEVGDEKNTNQGPNKETGGENFEIPGANSTETVRTLQTLGRNPAVGGGKGGSSKYIQEFLFENKEDLQEQELEGPCQEVSIRAPTTNGLDKNEDVDDPFKFMKQTNLKGSPEHDSELENSNSFLEKMNSKDSSMLSTTDTQDEIDTLDNGDQLFINHSKKSTENCSENKLAKKILNMEMESEDSLEDILGSDLDPQTEETFSIVSGSEYDEASQDSAHLKTDDVILLEKNEPATQNGYKSPEVHEIKSDNDDVDCVTTAEKDKTEIKKKATNTELRRSSRTIKRKRYSFSYDNEEESDIEELANEDQRRRNSKPIMINDTKLLIEIAAKQAARSTSAQRREPQLVLIGTHPIKRTASPNKSIISNMNTSLYQSIVARGTTVTPVPGTGKQVAAPVTQPSHVSQASQTPTPAILPSLTDDMFVVEAPSFIVPYVYEKPAIEPFKEFVTNLGKELEEQKIKAEKELLENNKEEKIKQQKERQEKRDRGEDVEDSDEEGHQRPKTEENKKRKIEKKEQKRRQKEDDESWDGSETTDSEDFKITDEDGRTILINDKDESIGEVKSNLQSVPASTPKSENYFDCSLGKFFITIGMGLVEEYVQTDLLKQQKRKLRREKKSGKSTIERELSISRLSNNLELSKANNKPYTCFQLKCEHCTYKTESALVLAQHLETPHMKNNIYKCNFCEFEIRSPHDILFHMEAEHNVPGKLERAPSYHQCCNCPFEDNGKGKLARHLVACAKKYKPEQNLFPPLDWEPPAKIPKVAKARNTMLGSPFTSSANSFGRPQFGSSFGRPPIVTGIMPGMSFRPRGRFPAPVNTRPVQAGGSIVRGSSILKQNAMATNYSLGNSKKSAGQPSISITPLPRHPPPVYVQAGQNTNGNFVICEICDGYIRDLDQLRNHMQWIHKVKIHPKMIYNRPPLNCQKCQFRFFTDQGLERHLLGSHGLVTSSMQEAANKSKDAGRCPVCGKVYQWKLLNHVAKDHSLTLKPAHLSYKCTVCTATFGMYKLFENHVYSAHSVVAKRVVDKNALAKGNVQGFQINDEITITAQPAMGFTAEDVKKDK